MGKALLFVAVFLAGAVSASAGTIFFKDGSSLSGVTIVSISDGKMIVEKSKTRKSYPLKSIKAYYGTDVATDGGAPDKYAEYKVSVLDLKIPKKGVDAKGKTAVVELQYSIHKEGKEKAIKVPYAYLYILTRGKDEFSGRKVHFYYLPKKSKPKGKGYDEAAILEKVLDFGRQTWSSDRKNIKGGLNGRTAKFPLKGVGDKKILAWHLEIWGGKEKVVDKSGVGDFDLKGAKVGKEWWKRLK